MKKTFYLGILILLFCWLLSMHTGMIPNAIVYSQKYFDIATMTKVGMPLNIIGIILIALCVQFLAVPILFN